MTHLVVREFQQDLAVLREKHAANPAEEWRELYLLALEREQLVTVHYSGSALHDRIDALDVPPEVRRIVHSALRWAARDEEMHTIYARGALLRRGARSLDLRALLIQMGGLIAGWSSAVSQHVTFSEAPISRSLSTLIGYAGILAGKVPKSARLTLSHRSFAEFAAFNAEAEETAAMCWERIAALDPDDRDLCLRVAADERKHAAVFQALVEAIGDSDVLRPGGSAKQLESKLRSIDEAFLPRDLRELDHRLGTGADVVVREDPSASPVCLLRDAVSDTGLLDRVFAERGGSGGRVVIKTQFMMSYDRRDLSTTVDGAMLADLCELLHARGARDIVVLETSNLYDRDYRRRSVEEVAAYMGLHCPHARLADTSLDQVPHQFKRGLGQNSISKSWKEADVRISFGKMRTNPSFLVHLTLANLETLGQRIDNVLFADRLADASTGLMMALDEFPCHLAILDATHDVPDGLTGILGTAEPRHPCRVYASEDAVALDWVATRHMGLTTLPRETSCAAALDWFGDARDHTKVVGVDRPIVPFTNPHSGDARILLSALAYPVYAYLSDGGSLWVPKMDTTAFPLAKPETSFAFAARRILRLLFGFGSPVGEWD